MMVLDAARIILFPAAMAIAASSDLLTMTISNRISIALALGFAVLAPLAGMGLEGIAWQILAGGIVLGLGFLCHMRGWVGGGDVKLASAIALWLGFGRMIDFLLIASIFGGALTLLILGFRRAPLPKLMQRVRWIGRLHDAGEGIPYGIALALAAMVIYPSTIWMKAIAG
jgi:prepilin peptidase CpaA